MLEYYLKSIILLYHFYYLINVLFNINGTFFYIYKVIV